ncbi:hypothetical protein Tco_0493499 [Tanacetum coccineum]
MAFYWHGYAVSSLIDTSYRMLEQYLQNTDEELTEKEVKQMKANDQAIHTILMGLSEDIYAAIDSCDTSQEIWLHV